MLVIDLLPDERTKYIVEHDTALVMFGHAHLPDGEKRQSPACYGRAGTEPHNTLNSYKGNSGCSPNNPTCKSPLSSCRETTHLPLLGRHEYAARALHASCHRVHGAAEAREVWPSLGRKSLYRSFHRVAVIFCF